MDIYFGTIVRAARVSDGGSIFKLDWESKTIVREVPIVPTEPALDHDPNARGNARGCRGIRVVGDEVIAADYHTLNLFDRDLPWPQFNVCTSHHNCALLGQKKAVLVL